MPWLSRVNFIASDTLSFTDINNLGNDIRAWGDNVNGGGYTLSNVAISASSGTMATVTGGTGTTSSLTLRSTSGVGTTGADIVFQTGNNGATEVMRLQNGGNVLVGTTSSGFNAAGLPLVVGSGSGNNGITIFSGSTTSGSIHFADTVTTGGGSYSGYINYNHNVNSMQFATDALERMRIDSSGNVGIGTSNPAAKLDVVGNLLLSGQSTASQYINVGYGRSGNGFSYIDFVGDTTYSPGLRLIRGNGGANTQSSLQHRGTGEFQLFAYEAAPIVFYSSSVERMRIDSSGNVKIGGTADRQTTVGTYHLDIFNGTAPAGTLTNGISIYSSSGEAYVMDASGNATLFSPHDRETNEWIFDSTDTRTGKRLKINVEKLLRFINDHFGLHCVHDLMEEA